VQCNWPEAFSHNRIFLVLAGQLLHLQYLNNIRKSSSWQQVLCYKYQYQYQY